MAPASNMQAQMMMPSPGPWTSSLDYSKLLALPILWPHHGQHYPGGPWNHCVCTNQRNNKTMDTTIQLLGYAALHPDAAIRFHKSDMILYVHSNASYLSEPNAKSQVGGLFYLVNADKPARVTKPSQWTNPHQNADHETCHGRHIQS